MGKLDNYITGRGGLTDKHNKTTNRRNSKKDNNKGKPILTSPERRVKKFRNVALFLLSAPVVLGSIQALIPVDEIIMQNKVAGADSDKLVKGFSAHSVELSKKYPGKAAWILTKNGQHIDHGTTKYIPIEGAYHAGFTHLNCDSESYITYYTRRIVSLWSSTEHNFNCQLGEEPNNIPG